MSAPKHTPGPWSATDIFELRGEGAAIDIEVKPGRRPRSDKNGGYIIARLCGPDMEANAPLIAAAPDLLAFLKKWKGFNIEGDEAEQDAYDAELAALIAKAEGT